MSQNNGREPMLEMFIFETSELMDQLEQSLLSSENENGFESSINEIFRIMHTVKGSSAMMLFNNISSLAHSLEDLFFYLREEKPQNVDSSKIIDIVLEGIDFIKGETARIDEGMEPNKDPSYIIAKVKDCLGALKSINQNVSTDKEDQGIDQHDEVKENQDQKYYISSTQAREGDKDNKYEAVLFFEDDCGMENIRAFSVVHDLKEIADVISFYPEDVMDSDVGMQIIRSEGFKVVFRTSLSLNEVKNRLSYTVLLKSLDVFVIDDIFDDFNKTDSQDRQTYKETKVEQIVLEDDTGAEKEIALQVAESTTEQRKIEDKSNSSSGKQSVISVNISKLDKLMDLVGELVISEAMVIQNPDLKGLNLESFNKASNQLNKITTELQDIVMSIRMVPLSLTFQKMNRIVRDMSKKLNKSVKLQIIGEETEVDKNIIERISDPLIHLIRNSIDHGIEEIQERVEKGKSPTGELTLEAKNAGGDVWIIVKDDGKGLDKDRILKRASENGLIYKPESELTDKEIYSFIFLPGFSTKENVTEFSGRGVGMDIVTQNIERVGGSIQVDSVPGQGTVFSIKFPLTLAIVDGMTIKIGKSRFTIPIASIRESFRVKDEALIKDTEGNELIMVRGECYQVLRLHSFYKVNTEITDIKNGIVIMVESGTKTLCLFADELIGEQQVVVKALPKYIKKVKGISGCTLLGDGSISLILDIAGLVNTQGILP